MRPVVLHSDNAVLQNGSAASELAADAYPCIMVSEPLTSSATNRTERMQQDLQWIYSITASARSSRSSKSGHGEAESQRVSFFPLNERKARCRSCRAFGGGGIQATFYICAAQTGAC